MLGFKTYWLFISTFGISTPKPSQKLNLLSDIAPPLGAEKLHHPPATIFIIC